MKDIKYNRFYVYVLVVELSYKKLIKVFLIMMDLSSVVIVLINHKFRKKFAKKKIKQGKRKKNKKIKLLKSKLLLFKKVIKIKKLDKIKKIRKNHPSFLENNPHPSK
jgi:cell division protein FtsL